MSHLAGELLQEGRLIAKVSAQALRGCLLNADSGVSPALTWHHRFLCCAVQYFGASIARATASASSMPAAAAPSTRAAAVASFNLSPALRLASECSGTGSGQAHCAMWVVTIPDCFSFNAAACWRPAIALYPVLDLSFCFALHIAPADADYERWGSAEKASVGSSAFSTSAGTYGSVSKSSECPSQSLPADCLALETSTLSFEDSGS